MCIITTFLLAGLYLLQTRAAQNFAGVRGIAHQQHQGSQTPLMEESTNKRVTIGLPSVAPASWYNRYVDPTFPAFACEERSFIYYAGPSGQPNTFSQNLINEVAKRTGVVPIIRVGGTSLDHSTYNASQQEAVTFPPGEAGKNVPFGLVFGPSFFDSFANLPSAKFVFDIPLATSNLDNARAFLDVGWGAIGRDRIEQIEIGNEPNLYPGKDRSGQYGPSQFVTEWIEWTADVAGFLGLSLMEPNFQAVALASPRLPPIGKWNVQNLYELGLNGAGPWIKSYSIHYYQTVASKTSSLQNLMNHTAIVRGTKALADTVAFLNSQDPPVPLNIAEFGSALNPSHNDYDLESVLGSALWQVDFMLWLLSIGVNRAHIQLGIGFGFAPWQPIDYKGIPAKVNAPYYAHVLIADFIGLSEKVQVLNIDMDSDVLSVYAAYEAGKLTKIAIVNLETWSSLYSSPQDRPVLDVKLELPPGATGVLVRRLTSPLGATAGDSSDISWSGLSWTRESNGMGQPVRIEANTVIGRGGKVVVELPASEAVVLELL